MSISVKAGETALGNGEPGLAALEGGCTVAAKDLVEPLIPFWGGLDGPNLLINVLCDRGSMFFFSFSLLISDRAPLAPRFSYHELLMEYLHCLDSL